MPLGILQYILHRNQNYIHMYKNLCIYHYIYLDNYDTPPCNCHYNSQHNYQYSYNHNDFYIHHIHHYMNRGNDLDMTYRIQFHILRHIHHYMNLRNYQNKNHLLYLYILHYMYLCSQYHIRYHNFSHKLPNM